MMLKSLSPASAAVGTSGNAGTRFSLVTSSGRNWPDLMNGATTEVASNIASSRPAIRSVIAGLLPLYGTWFIVGLPRRSRSSSIVTCGSAPTPPVP